MDPDGAAAVEALLNNRFQWMADQIRQDVIGHMDQRTQQANEAQTVQQQRENAVSEGLDGDWWVETYRSDQKFKTWLGEQPAFVKRTLETSEEPGDLIHIFKSFREAHPPDNGREPGNNQGKRGLQLAGSRTAPRRGTSPGQGRAASGVVDEDAEFDKGWESAA